MERNYSIDFVKFFAIFAVVAIHTGTLSGVKIGEINGEDIDFIIDTLARFAVPFFFITSGYLFVQKIKRLTDDCLDGKIKKEVEYFIKYTIKLVKLWIVWFSFYFIFDLIKLIIEIDKNSLALKTILMEYLSTIFTWELIYYGVGNSQYHLWFLLALVWSIIVLFIFMRIKMVPLLLILSMGLNIYGLFGQSYSSFYEVTVNTRDMLFFGLFYTTLGGMVGIYSYQIQKYVRKIPTFMYVALLVLFSVAQVLEGYVTLKLFNGGAENYYLATIPLTLILFLLIIKHNNFGKNLLVTKIGANAVGIYVAHVFVMEVIRIATKLIGLDDFQETLFWKMAFTPLVFILGYLMYVGIQIAKLQLKTLIMLNKTEQNLENIRERNYSKVKQI